MENIVTRIEEHYLGIRSLGVYHHAHCKPLMVETTSVSRLASQP
jgi:hypothetical protein